MKKIVLSTLVVGALFSCSENEKNRNKNMEGDTVAEATDDNFEYKADRFEDIQILRYQVKGFEKLTLQQKKLAYYLTQAGLSGRDIVWDQNYKYNLEIRDVLENIVKKYEGDREYEEWNSFMDYVKQVWFANGIHHHYSMDKFLPKFSEDYFKTLLEETGTSIRQEAMEAIFNPEIDNKRVDLRNGVDNIALSANNFYGKGVTQKMVDDYYNKIINKEDERPISYGLNSQMVVDGNGVKERVWKVGGMYGNAIEKVVFWLEKAIEVAENEPQKEALKLLVKYYNTGDLKDWDDYSIAWTEATEGDIDYINGFIEVYGDAAGYRANYETIVQMNDFEASERMSVVAHSAQWFENQSPIMNEHKKKNVTGVSYKVVTVVGEAGDTSPSTPIGVNLPNAEWIRADHGSKSISLGNIIDAYHSSSSGSMIEEFGYTSEEIERAKKWGKLGDNLHTALHEVVGHASGQLNPGVGTPKETLKTYASALEEARADLVGLYYLLDEKLIELGLMKTLDVGRAEYENYIRNGLMLQLRRLELGKDLEEAHMRNRQLVAGWAYENGKENNVIERVVRDDKTYFVINDYDALRNLFGQLLREIQRIKSEGDYAAGQALIENYGVKVDHELHAEVLRRTEPLNIAPYSGFINPEFDVLEDENGEITDIRVTYPTDFAKQMLEYSEKYGYLEHDN